ncbi:efflux RND transporter periplasmic adaptor subunit [Paracoccus sp. (in: a-proteobacteria)]|uniref:efflux RND transporter periplasmic adaptor subunit n=1 Tax=Paracoccus sp. TaxID=267 RepID=UPI0026E0008D|nr:efflux RND transporter periplasmic adaptor subunit [Paracoccus sp. (in: a-proteobacteria)]MDO5647739.1 efflux RND transporter periplasmic adaptor subunit [Paracoccus sp. (in: a-proteobacteria)]
MRDVWVKGVFLALLSFWAVSVAWADPLRVEFVAVTDAAMSADITLTGTIQARDTVQLGFRYGGRIEQVLVREGDRVARGQPLARLSAVQQEQALIVAEAGFQAAMAVQAQADQANDRAAGLLARGAGTRAARDGAEQALSQAAAALEQADSQRQQARRAVEDTVLRAPDDGVIVSKSVAPGQVVAAAQPVLTLAALSGLDAVFQTADDRILADVLGADVALTPLDVAHPPMRARISEVSPLVDPRTGTVNLRASILTDDPDIGLLGAAVRGRVTLPDPVHPSVPWTALVRHGGGAAVWVVGDDGRVSMQPIDIAGFGDGLVYLAGGVSVGQMVVGQGAQRLYPGRSVTAWGPK